MKKIGLALMLSAAVFIGKAQDGNNICVWNSMNTYNGGGGPDDLERGLKCSDEASVNEATVNKAKTWFYRGEIYTLAFLDTTIRKRNGTTGFEAIKAFKKLSEINDPKFKDWEDVYKYIFPLATTIFNEGVDKYQSKNYAEAYKYFYSIKDLNGVLTLKGKKANIDLATSLKNAAVCAENSGDQNAAMGVYKDWLATSPDSIVYAQYGTALKKAGKIDESKKIVDEGIAKYPKNANILVQKINFMLDAQQYAEALNYVNNLLEIDPKNSGALFVKAQAFDKMGKEDSVVYYYNKSIETNPSNTDAMVNLAAVYVNKAVPMVEEMNKLTTSKEDTKRFDELKAKVKELYTKAKPYLTKALDTNPALADVKRTLARINSFMAGN